MGTDVHSVFQVKNEQGEWEDIVNPWDESRHYFLFAILADVRNGFGFGGVARHVPLESITSGRGFPDDFRIHRRKHHNDEWMGDHSYTWVFGSELMNWYNGDIINVSHTGILSKEAFDKWNGDEPKAYSSAVWGGNTKIADDVNSYVRVFGTNLKDNEVIQPLTPDCTHVRVFWNNSAQSQVAYFFDGIIKPLMDEYGEIRLVMGFDS